MMINMAISIVVSEEFQEPFIYKQALALPEAKLWEQPINEDVQALKKNHTRQMVDTPSNANVLGGK